MTLFVKYYNYKNHEYNSILLNSVNYVSDFIEQVFDGIINPENTIDLENTISMLHEDIISELGIDEEEIGIRIIKISENSPIIWKGNSKNYLG